MQKRRLLGYALAIGLTVSIVIGGAGTALAVTSSSPNYQVTETQFGSSTKSCSGQYCAQASIGEATDGKAIESSTANFEDITNNEPFLDMIVEAGESNLGVLSTERTATKVTSIKVRSYLISGGYTLQILGESPKYNGHTLFTPTTPTASVTGTEMFGINVVANTTPVVGANPVQVPADQQEFGKVEDNYNQSNMFMYNGEDVIARGQTDSGRTDYTVSMIVNISSSTPAGKYTGDFTAMLIPAY
ncbi:MAG: hypothetical protein V4611_01670 [Patescibacteria group bacterium]